MPNPNPFLTSDLISACTDARALYMQTLYELITTAQDAGWLRRMLQQSQSSIDTIWKTAEGAVSAGNVLGAASLLECIMKEWGKCAAIQYVIDADTNGIGIDLWDSTVYVAIQQAFSMAAHNKAVTLATQLHNATLAGEAKHEQEMQNSLMQGYSELQRINLQAVQQSHLTSQQYADAALQGVRQAQQGVYWMQEGVMHMYEFVQGTQSNMVGGMQALQDHLEQKLPSSIEEGHRRRTTRMLLWTLIILGVIAGLIGLAVLIGTNLVGG